MPVSGTVKKVTLFIEKIPDNAVGVSGMTMRDSAHAPAGGRGAARGATGFGRLEKRPPQEKSGDTRLAGRRFQPSPRLQGQRAGLAYNGGKRA